MAKRTDGGHPCDAKSSGLESGCTSKEGFHDEQVLPKVEFKSGPQRATSAVEHEAPGGHTIK